MRPRSSRIGRDRNRGARRSGRALTLWQSHNVVPGQTRIDRHVRADGVTTTRDPIEIDFSVIEDLADGDPSVLAELIQTFERHTAEGIAKVRAALSAKQFQEAALGAHTCIGFTATIGIAPMVPTLRQLELAVTAERVEEATRLLAQWELEFKQVRLLLRRRIEHTNTM